MSGFCILKALSTRNEEPDKASRPFDAERDGFVPAEGAAILILESLEHALDRGATILAEVAGYGTSCDAFHAVPAGRGPGKELPGLSGGLWPTLTRLPKQLTTSTPTARPTQLNDAIETIAIKTVFGERAYKVPISSTKSMVGHALGGSGALEAVVCVKSILDGVIHPTVNQEHPDPSCDLDYVPNVARQQRVDVALSNSFGFGGQNTCTVFRRFAE